MTSHHTHELTYAHRSDLLACMEEVLETTGASSAPALPDPAIASPAIASSPDAASETKKQIADPKTKKQVMDTEKAEPIRGEME